MLDFMRRLRWTSRFIPRMAKKAKSNAKSPPEGAVVDVSELCPAADALAPLKHISAYMRQVEQISLKTSTRCMVGLSNGLKCNKYSACTMKVSTETHIWANRYSKAKTATKVNAKRRS